MDFSEIVVSRQSCRNFDETRMIEDEKLQAILSNARFSPSACNGQPYFLTVCKGEKAKQVAKATMGMGMNKFTTSAPVQIVISEMPYVKTAALGAKLKGNDYRSIDIGIVAAYITAMATELGIGSCVLGWLDNEKIKEICEVSGDVRLAISLGYAKADDKLRNKIRKPFDELIKIIE